MKRSLLFLACLLTTGACSFAQWNKDTTVRNQVCTATGLQYEPLMCTDGNKGVIIAWADQRVSNSQQIYAQRVDSNGVNKWAANGVVLSVPATSIGVDYPLIVSDGSGGAIIFYNITISGGADQIFAQRLDGNGNELWAAGGVPVATTRDSRIRSNEAAANNNADADGNGGAFITYQEYNPFNNIVQHIDKSGNLLWGTDGTQVTSNDSTNARYESYVINTGGGTAVVGYSYYPRLYLQRISAAGAPLWSTGVLVADSFYNNGSNQGAFLVYDSVSRSKNVMISWLDIRNSATGSNIYSQKVALNGNIIWQKNGIAITQNAFYSDNPDMLTDNDGGFFITYDSTNAVKVQHVNSNGQLLWGSIGISVAPAYSGTNPVIGDDGSGGIIAMWFDERTGSGYNNSALFAQRYNLQGSALWRPNGIAVIADSVSINHSANPIISLGDGTSIACWSKGITNSNDIYAAKFGGTTGLLPVNLISFTAALQKNTTQLQWVTALEINSSYFEVERAENNLQFTPLAKVLATGNTNTQHTYTATDANPAAGINYYRLKEVDKDGSFIYSNIAEVTINGMAGFIAYPNPVKDIITLKINTTAQKSSFSMFDARGRLVMQKEVLLVSGDNTINWSVGGLAPGIYYVEAGKTGMRLKIMKQ